MNANRFSLLVVFLLLAAAARAQVDRGTIVGTVSDQNAALIPGVTVTVANLETGRTVRVTTDETGGYTAGMLLIGSYSVSAEKSGFQKVIQAKVKVDVNKIVRVDMTLPVGIVT